LSKLQKTRNYVNDPQQLLRQSFAEGVMGLQSVQGAALPLYRPIACR